jgi:hypothetical protein
MVIEISGTLTHNALDLIYTKIRAIPLENYTELELQLLKGFTKNANEQVYYVSQGTTAFQPSTATIAIESLPDNEETFGRIYGVSELWRLTQDDSTLSGEHALNTLNFFCKLF